MKKIFIIIWIISVLFAAFVLVGTANKELGRKWLHHYTDEYSHGDLYQASMLDDFKERLHGFNLRLDAKLTQAQVITFGDSFLGVDFGSPSFDVELQQKIGKPVFKKMDYAAFDRSSVDFNPLNFLQSIHYIKSEKKYMLVETIERFSIQNAASYEKIPQQSKKMGLLKRAFDGISWRMSSFDNWARQHIIFLNNNNYSLQYFFHENMLCFPLNHWIANVRFHLLGEVDPAVGAYSLKYKMLFDAQGVKFTKRKKSEEEINEMVDNIAYLAHRLKADYNIELIYVIVPNKYSIYNDYVTGFHVYDNFIPETINKIKQRGVNAIDLYSAYMDYRVHNSSQQLYLNSDEHFGPLGKSIMVDLTAKELPF